MSFYLAIVSPTDSPLFETQFSTSRNTSTSTQSFPTWSTFTSPNGSDLGPSGGAGYAPSHAGSGGGTGAGSAEPGPGNTGVAAGVEGKIGGNMGLLMVPGSRSGDGERHLMQMVVHKSLDSVDEVVDTTGSL